MPRLLLSYLFLVRYGLLSILLTVMLHTTAHANITANLHRFFNTTLQKTFLYQQQLTYPYNPTYGHYFITPHRDYILNNLPAFIFIDPKISPEQKQILQKAVKIWAHYFPLQETTEQESAHITLRTIQHLPQEELYDYTGYTRWINKGTTSIHSVILIKNDIQNRQLLLWVAMHEIGHAIGIVNHSKNPQDIMFPVYPKKYTGIPIPQQPTSRDLNTLKILYDGNMACHFPILSSSKKDQNLHFQECLPQNQNTSTYKMNLLHYAVILLENGRLYPAVNIFASILLS